MNSQHVVRALGQIRAQDLEFVVYKVRLEKTAYMRVYEKYRPKYKVERATSYLSEIWIKENQRVLSGRYVKYC